MEPECSREHFRPYISKRKRKAQQQEVSSQKRTLIQPADVKEIFSTDDTIYSQSLRTKCNNWSPLSCIRVTQVSEHPLWSVKWCKKFSHLIACTTEKSLNLFNAVRNGQTRCVWNSTSDARPFKDIDWSRTCRQLAACSIDKRIEIWDFLNGGKMSCSMDLEGIPSGIRYWPEDDSLILVGGHDSFLATYDLRTGKVATKYQSRCGNILSIEILPNAEHFVTSGDCVSEESAAYSIIVWDFASGAKISNQIFHEKYSCPKICAHPSGSAFLAQTNGDYIARFSATKPFHLDRCLRYDKHKVSGFPVGMDISPDGKIVVSGSSDGSVVFYKYKDSSVLRTLVLPKGGTNPSRNQFSSTAVHWHPVLPSMVAIGDWLGRLNILQ